MACSATGRNKLVDSFIAAVAGVCVLLCRPLRLVVVVEVHVDDLFFTLGDIGVIVDITTGSSICFFSSFFSSPLSKNDLMLKDAMLMTDSKCKEHFCFELRLGDLIKIDQYQGYLVMEKGSNLPW